MDQIETPMPPAMLNSQVRLEVRRVNDMLTKSKDDLVRLRMITTFDQALELADMYRRTGWHDVQVDRRVIDGRSSLFLQFHHDTAPWSNPETLHGGG